MGIILTIIFGALVGWIASIVTGRNAEQGWIANIVVGVVGAFLGGWIASLFGSHSLLAFDIVGLFWAFVGAVGLCVILNLIQKRRTGIGSH